MSELPPLEGHSQDSMFQWLDIACTEHGSFRVRLVLKNWDNGARTYAVEYAPVADESWDEAERNKRANAALWQLKQTLEAAEHDVQ